MIITSVNNPNVIKWAKLKKSKYQREYGQFIIEEKLIIEEAIKADLKLETISLDTSDIKSDYKVSDNVMKKISSNTSLNEIIAIVDFYESDESLSDKIVYLDNVQDPGNLGTIIRTAYAFGYTTIAIRNGVNKYNHKLISASKGSIFHVNLIEDDNLDLIKNSEYKKIGLMLDESASSLDDSSLLDKSIIIFGNEGSGISKEITDLLDQSVYIEMNNFDSLNVAITAGIVLYKFR